MDDAARRARLRQDETRAEVDRLKDVTRSAQDAQVCVTTTVAGSTYPTAAGRKFWVQPQREDGPVAEGAAVTYASRAAPFQAIHVGATPPPQGSRVLVYQVERVGHVFDW